MTRCFFTSSPQALQRLIHVEGLWRQAKNKIFKVGLTGFEPATSCYNGWFCAVSHYHALTTLLAIFQRFPVILTLRKDTLFRAVEDSNVPDLYPIFDA